MASVKFFSIQYGKCERYSCPCTCHKDIGRMEAQLHLLLILALNRGKWSDLFSGCFTPSTHGKKSGWAPEQVQMLWRRGNLLCVAGNQNTIPCFSSLWSSHYTNYATLVPKVCKSFYSIVITIHEISQTWIMISFMVHKMAATHHIGKTVLIS